MAQQQVQKTVTASDAAISSCCLNCGNSPLSVFYRVNKIPVHSCLLINDRNSAKVFPRGDLSLGFCPTCGFISNVAFDPAMETYGRIYEETQGFSPCFNRFMDSLARRLISKFNVRNKKVLEIGCGKGEFLAAMCTLGHNEGIGIDPGCNPDRLPEETRNRITLIRDFYGEAYTNITADFVCCRHTLEHIAPTREFLLTVRGAMSSSPQAIAFFEVPDVLRVLRERAFWDIYYEHCSYFSAGSLARLFRSCGFDIIDLELDYDNQYILLTARPTSVSKSRLTIEHDMEDLRAKVARFSFMVSEDLEMWRRRMNAWFDNGVSVALWGAGSKCVSFLTTLQLDEQVCYVCDINPFKQGTYTPGTGHAIVSPEYLASRPPDVVIAMNRIYRPEIAAELDRLKVRAELLEV